MISFLKICIDKLLSRLGGNLNTYLSRKIEKMQQADGHRSQRTIMTTDNYTPAYEGPIKQMKEVLRTFNLPQINHVETKFQHIYT